MGNQEHLSARAALIQFTSPKRRNDPRGMRNRSLKVKARRGHFVDVKTIVAALTGHSSSLATLTSFLKTEHRKDATDEHDQPLTATYLAYAMNDVQATWDCYQLLSRKYADHRLTTTPITRILSEAGLGKAYLKEMGVQPWREAQPDFPDDLIGVILSAYYGGRSEVRLRRIISQVLYCDFLSMYPTVCTLMGLWRFVIATGMTWREAKDETTAFLDRVTLDDLQRPDTWPQLVTLVQILPDNDILPVRAHYGGEQQATIGLNYLSSDMPLWFTLADCIAAKLLGGKPPKIARAIAFTPGEMQDGLNPIAIMGKRDYKVDPRTTDFYRRVIDLRNSVKIKLKRAVKARAEELDSEQQFLTLFIHQHEALSSGRAPSAGLTAAVDGTF